MFAYLISKLLCNIYQSLDDRSERTASLEWTKTSFGSRETLKETYLESILKVLGRKIIFYVFILIFPTENSLVIPLGHFSAWLVHIRRSSCWQAYLLKVNFNVIASYKLANQLSFLK